jgi:hypothetical protein
VKTFDFKNKRKNILVLSCLAIFYTVENYVIITMDTYEEKGISLYIKLSMERFKTRAK